MSSSLGYYYFSLTTLVNIWWQNLTSQTKVERRENELKGSVSKCNNKKCKQQSTNLDQIFQKPTAKNKLPTCETYRTCETCQNKKGIQFNGLRDSQIQNTGKINSPKSKYQKASREERNINQYYIEAYKCVKIRNQLSAVVKKWKNRSRNQLQIEIWIS